MADPELMARTRDEALQVARGWSGPDAAPTWALTAALFTGLAADDALLALAATIPPDRLPPLLFVASVQRLAARRADHPFAAYFPRPTPSPAPTVGGGGQPGLDLGQPPLDDRFADRYRDFGLEHRHELAELWGRHFYQMNEVARCAQTTLALGVLLQLAPGRDVALVDVGTGSGLGLYLDRYRYVLGDGTTWGDARSPVEIRTELTGPERPPVPPALPVAHRVGIDVDPIDLEDPDQRAWLMACSPPEVGALARLAAAMEVARDAHAQEPGRVTIIRGRAEERLGEVIDAVPDGPLVVVVDTYTSVFLDASERQALGDAIAEAGSRRDVAWVALDPLVPLGTEARRTVQGAAAPAALVEQNRHGVFAALSLLSYLDGRPAARLLGTAHPSGTRFAWLDEPAVPSSPG